MSLLALSVYIGPALKDNHLLLNRTIHWGWGSVWNSFKHFKIAKLPTLSFSQESPYSWLTWSWCHVSATIQPWNWNQLIVRQVTFAICIFTSIYGGLSSVFQGILKKAPKIIFTDNSILLRLSSFFFYFTWDKFNWAQNEKGMVNSDICHSAERVSS